MIIEMNIPWEFRSWKSPSRPVGVARGNGHMRPELPWRPMEKPWKSRSNTGVLHDIPSGKRLHNYGKSPFFMGKSTINGHVQ